MKPNEGFNFTWGMAQELLNQLGYVQVTGFMLDAYAELGLSRNEFLCIIHLARFHYNSPQGIARPSAANVAQKMGYGHPNSIRQLVKTLEKKKMLLVTRRSGKCSIYDASPFAKAAFEIWQKQNPHIPMLGSNGNTLTSQCETPSYPNVTEENKEAKKLAKEKNISPVSDGNSKFDKDGAPIDVPKPKKRYVSKCEYEDEQGNVEVIEDDEWKYPKKQIEHQALGACGRESFRTKKEYNRLRKIEAMLESGKLPEEFWRNRVAAAEKHHWSFPDLLRYTLSVDLQRKWKRQQKGERNDELLSKVERGISV